MRKVVKLGAYLEEWAQYKNDMKLDIQSIFEDVKKGMVTPDKPEPKKVDKPKK